MTTMMYNDVACNVIWERCMRAFYVLNHTNRINLRSVLSIYKQSSQGLSMNSQDLHMSSQDLSTMKSFAGTRELHILESSVAVRKSIALCQSINTLKR